PCGRGEERQGQRGGQRRPDQDAMHGDSPDAAREDASFAAGYGIGGGCRTPAVRTQQNGMEPAPPAPTPRAAPVAAARARRFPASPPRRNPPSRRTDGSPARSAR